MGQAAVSFGELRRAAIRARWVASYVQGTMGLEGQGLTPDAVRQLVRRSVAGLVISPKAEAEH